MMLLENGAALQCLLGGSLGAAGTNRRGKMVAEHVCISVAPRCLLKHDTVFGASE